MDELDNISEKELTDSTFKMVLIQYIKRMGWIQFQFRTLFDQELLVKFAERVLIALVHTIGYYSIDQ